MNDTDKNLPTNRIIELDNPALPLICPHPEMAAPFAHPRAYLQPDANGACRCPWCNTLYLIRSFTV